MASLTYLQAIILGLVQGLAEFLPISSSGHLALLQYFFHISGDQVLLFTVLLHVGTLISVFIVYWKDIVELFRELVLCLVDIFRGRGPRINANPTRRLGFMIIVATIPTGLIGVLFNDTFESFYTNIIVIGVGLAITGFLLLIAQRLGTGRKDVRRMKFRNAVFVGIMQGIAITPGISRSGSTLFGGLVTGLERRFAVKFAFLVSIPSIIGSVVTEMPKAMDAGFAGATAGPVIVGVAVSAVSGLIAIRTMIRVVSDKKLIGFSWYVWILGAFVILYGIFFAA
ncbi:MAG: undecaprenyl-diphosphate phosphatase [Anaerovoracaceae bacterium]|jgi:undecaprenyl-diphosphatase